MSRPTQPAADRREWARRASRPATQGSRSGIRYRASLAGFGAARLNRSKAMRFQIPLRRLIRCQGDPASTPRGGSRLDADRRSQRRRADAGPAPACAAPEGAAARARCGRCDRHAGRHEHGAVDVPHRSAAARARHRRQRLVLSRPVRGLALAAVESAGRRREDLGCGATARSGVHLRQAVLVVQHVRQRRLLGHAAADVSGRRAQAARHLHPAGRGFATSCRASSGEFPLFRFWGPGADIVSTAWIADSALHVLEQHPPTLTLVYLPHLDYNLQRLGPRHPRIAARCRRKSTRLCGD